MLTKRTQILFDPDTYSLLTSLSNRENKSLGELIRIAVKKTYKQKVKKKEKEKSLAEVLKDSFGAWKNRPETDEELMNVLSGPWTEFAEI